MKLLISFFILSTMLLFTAGISYAQQTPEDLKQKERTYLQRTLNIDSAKALQVSQIMDAYKAGMKAVLTETSLSQEARKEKIIALMADKNKKLEALLTAEQQSKIIPTTEREPVKTVIKN
jgi:hypothetical protein